MQFRAYIYEGIIQTIVRGSLTKYQAYASPSQTILGRLVQFTGCTDWSKGVARIRCEDCGQKRTLLHAEYLEEDLLLDLPHRQGKNCYVLVL